MAAGKSRKGQGPHRSSSEDNEMRALILAPTRLWPIVLVCGLQMGAYGVTYPATSQLILDEVDGDDARASIWSGALLGVRAGLEFFSLPLLGTLSDHVGRKPILLLGSTTSLLGWLILAFLPCLETLVAAFVLSGCTNAVFTIAFAVITDVTAHRIAHRHETSSSKPNTSGPSLLSSDDNIAHHFGLIGVAWGAGLILGPVTGGALLKWFGIQIPFVAGAAICGICTLVIVAGVTESLHKAQAFSWNRANPFPFLRWFFKKKELAVLGVPFCLNQFAFGCHSIWFFYVNRRYGWEAVQIGMFLSAVGLVSICVQGIGIKFIIPKRLSLAKTVLVSLGFHTVASIGYGTAPVGFVLYVVLGVTAIAFLSEPSLRSVMALWVPVEEQGALQGAISSLRTLSLALGSPAAGALFWYGIHHGIGEHPEHSISAGLPFFVSALCFGIAGVVAAWALVKYPPPEAPTKSPAEEPSVDVEMTASSKRGSGLWIVKPGQAQGETGATAVV